MLDLARRHRLRHTRAPDGQVIIPGKRGFIYRHGPDRLGWCLVHDYRNGRPTAHLKEAAKKDSRLTLYLEGDEEGVFVFATGDLGWVADRWCAARHLPGPKALSVGQRRKLGLAGAKTRIGAGGVPPALGGTDADCLDPRPAPIQ